jgi:hypothetical protein
MKIYLIVDYSDYDPMYYAIMGAYSNEKDANDFLEKLAGGYNIPVKCRTDGTKYAKGEYSAFSTKILEVKSKVI